MLVEFKMPKIGEGITEGTIVEWKVKVGDEILEDATLVEIQNDKLIQEVPSPINGTIHKILESVGTVVKIGDTLAEIEVTNDATIPNQNTSIDSQHHQKHNEGINNQTASDRLTHSILSRVLAMPSIRQYARDQGVDIFKVNGSGKHGHITRSDIDAYLSSSIKVENIPEKDEPIQSMIEHSVETEATRITLSENTYREKISVTRRAISKAMTNSQKHASHVAIFDEVEVSRLITHLDRFKDIAQVQDIKLTYLAYMVKSVVTVLRKYPILNASLDESSDEIVYKKFFNIGIAVDTQKGLYVPNIKEADRKGIFTIAKEITDLANKAHEGSLEPHEMKHGSTTITSIGSLGGMWFTPIINYPEVAIFGMGKIQKKPMVLEDDSIGVGSMMHLSMSFDHRIIDGAVAQKAMNELKRHLSDPDLLLMEGG